MGGLLGALLILIVLTGGGGRIWDIPLTLCWIVFGAGLVGYAISVLAYMGIVAFVFAKYSLAHLLGLLLLVCLCVSLLITQDGAWRGVAMYTLILTVVFTVLHLLRQDPTRENFLPYFVRKERGDRVRARIKERRRQEERAESTDGKRPHVGEVLANEDDPADMSNDAS